jgi:hypothetical protein
MYSYGPNWADTEYEMRSGIWSNGDQWPYPWNSGLDVVINNVGYDWVGSYPGPAVTNVYSLEYPVTADGHLNFKILDDAYGDNVGTLTVEIYAQL